MRTLVDYRRRTAIVFAAIGVAIFGSWLGEQGHTAAAWTLMVSAVGGLVVWVVVLGLRDRAVLPPGALAVGHEALDAHAADDLATRSAGRWRLSRSDGGGWYLDQLTPDRTDAVLWIAGELPAGWWLQAGDDPRTTLAVTPEQLLALERGQDLDRDVRYVVG